MTSWLFPTATLLMSAGASVVYAAGGDIRHCIYWLAATVITAVVTF